MTPPITVAAQFTLERFQMIVCKQFTFHAAHKLPHHDGACRNLHGHTYKLEVLVDGSPSPVMTGQPKSDEGMVVDFGEIKAAYKTFIEPKVEHQYLNETLQLEVPVTTCELMAQWMRLILHNSLVDELHPDIYNLGVRLWETPTSSAEVWN